MFRIKSEKSKKQSVFKNNFIFHLLIFFLFGLLICNLLRLASLWKINELNNILQYYSIIPSILSILIVIIYCRNITKIINKWLKKHSLKSVIFLSFLGLTHTFISIIFFRESINYFGMSAIVIGISNIILYFNTFNEYDKYIEQLEKNNYSDKIKILYDDFRMWNKEILNIILYFTLGIGAFLAIVWGFTPDALGKYQTVYQRIVSIGIILVYTYMLFGILIWIYNPILQKMELLRNLLFED